MPPCFGATGRNYGKINDSGDLVGTYRLAGVTHGFLYSSGVYQTLDDPGGAQTLDWGISNDGTVAGYYLDGGGTSHGFVEKGGVFTTVECAGDTYSTITGINNNDRAVGNCGFADGSSTDFIYAAGVVTTVDINEPNALPYAINDQGALVGTYSTDGVNLIGFVAVAAPEPASFGSAAAGVIVLICLGLMRRQNPV
jgi:hypothetical protein